MSAGFAYHAVLHSLTWQTLAMQSLTRTPSEVFTKPRDDLVTALLGGWLMIGLLIDGWAHRNNAGIENFFTPWHAAFYSGFIAVAGWIVYLTRRPRSGFVTAGVPVGYGLGIAGIAVFALGGIGDMIWHSLFGIEVSIDALVSPTHLVLLTGILLILTSPVRSAWHRPTAREVGWKLAGPAVVAVGLVTLLIQFFYMYASGLTTDSLSVPYRLGDDFPVIFGILEITITNLLFVGSGLVLIRRWRPPAGTFTFIGGLLGIGMQALVGFEDSFDVLPALLGGAVADLLIQTIGPTPLQPRSFRLWAVTAPMGLWTVVVAQRAVIGELAWPITLWLGVIVMMGLWGLGLSVLIAPPPLPSASRSAASASSSAASASSESISQI